MLNASASSSVRCRGSRGPEQVGDGLDASGLVEPIRPTGPRLINRCVQAGNDLAVLVHDATSTMVMTPRLSCNRFRAIRNRSSRLRSRQPVRGSPRTRAGADDAAVAVRLICVPCTQAPRPCRLRRGSHAGTAGDAGAGGEMRSARWSSGLQPAAQGLHHRLCCAFFSIASSEAASNGSPLRTPGRCPRRECASSRSSSRVNFICAGPRRPKTCTSVTEAFGPSSVVGISVTSGSSACLEGCGETSGRRCRYRALQPAQLRAARCGIVGVAVVPGRRSLLRRRGRPESMPSMFRGASKIAPSCEDDGVVVFAQVGEGQVLAVFGVAEEGCRRGPGPCAAR